MRLKGSRLIPYSEVTNKAFVEIDLALATSVIDLNTSDSSADYDDAESCRMERSFRLNFQDGSEISFYADSDEDKRKWIKVLGGLKGEVGEAKAPMWALALRKSVSLGNK
jgi:hypothetical protein